MTGMGVALVAMGVSAGLMAVPAAAQCEPPAGVWTTYDESGWDLVPVFDPGNNVLGFVGHLDEDFATGSNLRWVWIEPIGQELWGMSGWTGTTYANVRAFVEDLCGPTANYTSLDLWWSSEAPPVQGGGTPQPPGPVVPPTELDNGLMPGDPLGAALATVEPSIVPDLLEIFIDLGSAGAPLLSAASVLNTQDPDCPTVAIDHLSMMMATDAAQVFGLAGMDTCTNTVAVGASVQPVAGFLDDFVDGCTDLLGITCQRKTWTTAGPPSAWSCAGGPTSRIVGVNEYCDWTGCTRTRATFLWIQLKNCTIVGPLGPTVVTEGPVNISRPHPAPGTPTLCPRNPS